MAESDDPLVSVPLSVLTEVFNTMGDCLCFPSGEDPHNDLLDKLDALLAPYYP